MRLETNKDIPMDISIMLNRADIDKLIRRLQHLKSHPKEHIDIFCTDFENDPAIANIEISYFKERAANYSMDGEWNMLKVEMLTDNGKISEGDINEIAINEGIYIVI